MNLNFRLNFKMVAIVVVFLGIIWFVSTCGCTHGGMYGLYEGLEGMANGDTGAGLAVKTTPPVVAVDSKTKAAAKKASTGGTKTSVPAPGAKASAGAPKTPSPVTASTTTDKKGNASVSATASPANPKEGYTNLMGYNSTNSTVNWGDPAPVANYVAPSQENPLSYGELDMFANTPFKPECCPTTYSNSMGCACINKEQYNYLITRGGNNVPFAII